MIASIVGSVVGLASSVATIWAVLEVYTPLSATRACRSTVQHASLLRSTASASKLDAATPSPSAVAEEPHHGAIPFSGSPHLYVRQAAGVIQYLFVAWTILRVNRYRKDQS